MTALQWWLSRTARERITLLAGCVCVLAIAGYLLLEPAMRERARMVEALPALRADLAWMQAQVDEVRELRGRSGAAALNATTVADALRRTALSGQVSELYDAAGGAVVVRFDEVGYASLIDLLHDVTRTAAARVDTAVVTRVPDKPGAVSARIAFDAGNTP